MYYAPNLCKYLFPVLIKVRILISWLHQWPVDKDLRKTYNNNNNVFAPLHWLEIKNLQHSQLGPQWLSDRVFDSWPRGSRSEPHWRHCVVSLSKTHLSLLSTCSTQEDPSGHKWKIVEWDIKKQIKQTKHSQLIKELSAIILKMLTSCYC